MTNQGGITVEFEIGQVYTARNKGNMESRVKITKVTAKMVKYVVDNEKDEVLSGEAKLDSLKRKL